MTRLTESSPGGHAVQRIGRLDRPPVVGDDDELGLVRQAPQAHRRTARCSPRPARRRPRRGRRTGPAAPRASRTAARRRSARVRRPTASRGPAASCPAGVPRSRCRSCRYPTDRSARAARTRRQRAARTVVANAVSSARNVVWNRSPIIVSSSAISSRVRAIAVRRSAACASSVSSRACTPAYSSTANGFTAPSSWKRRRS